MRYAILFLAIAVSAGCAKEMTLNEIETEVHNICKQRIIEGEKILFEYCFDEELEKLIQEQSGDCEREQELRPYEIIECWGFLNNDSSNCDPGMESCT